MIWNLLVYRIVYIKIGNIKTNLSYSFNVSNAYLTNLPLLTQYTELQKTIKTKKYKHSYRTQSIALRAVS